MNDKHAVQLRPNKPKTSVVSILALVLAIVAIAVVGFLVVQSRSDDKNNSNDTSVNDNNDDSDDDNDTPVVTNFAECAAAGNAVAESYPRQCTANGKTYVEELKGPFDFTSDKGVTLQLADIHANQSVKTPLTVTGKVPGSWSFEAVFPIDIRDSSGKVLATAQARLEGDWMTDELVPFTAKLEFDAPSDATIGSIVLHKDNPSDLPANDDSVVVPVVFE